MYMRSFLGRPSPSYSKKFIALSRIALPCTRTLFPSDVHDGLRDHEHVFIGHAAAVLRASPATEETYTCASITINLISPRQIVINQEATTNLWQVLTCAHI